MNQTNINNKWGNLNYFTFHIKNYALTSVYISNIFITIF